MTAPEPSEPRAPASLREKNRERTRQDIEAAAFDLFKERGFNRTTVSKIARDAGCSSATFFRYFRSKEDVLFANEQAAAAELARCVSERDDRSLTLSALSAPVTRFAQEYLVDATSDSQRLTHLVMTTPELEERSLRMRYRWERAIARTLGQEADAEKPGVEHNLLAALAVSCLSTALWHWQNPAIESDLAAETHRAFLLAVQMSDS